MELNFQPEMLNLYHFNIFPRNFGTPMQRQIINKQILLSYIKHYNGHTPIFVSHNSFSDDITLYVQMPWDVDTDKDGITLENAYHDLKALADRFSNNEILLTFSGSGFHFYLEFEPTYIPLTQELSAKVHTFQGKIVDELGLKSVNLACAEPKRLIRVPTTRYVYQNGQSNYVKTDRYSIPINRRILESYSVKDILELSKTANPTFFEPNISKKKIPIKELLDIKIETKDTKYFEPITMDWSYLNEENLKHYLSYILDSKMIYELWQEKPSHTVRFMACLKLKEFGLSLSSTIQVFDRLSYFSKWSNRNLAIQYQQIKYIYERYLQ